MNENRIKSLVEILKTTIRELEDEVKSNKDLFIGGTACADIVGTHDYDYSELLTYMNTNDEDGDPD